MSWAPIVGCKTKAENKIYNVDRKLGVNPEQRNMRGINVDICHNTNHTNINDHLPGGHVTTNGITHCRNTRTLIRFSYAFNGQGETLCSVFNPYYWWDKENCHVGTTRYLIFIPIDGSYMLVITNQFGHARKCIVRSAKDAFDTLPLLRKCFCVEQCHCDNSHKLYWEDGNKIMLNHARGWLALHIKEQLEIYLPTVLCIMVWSYCRIEINSI